MTGCIGSNVDSSKDSRLNDRANTALTSELHKETIQPLANNVSVEQGGTFTLQVDGMPTNKMRTDETKTLDTALDMSLREMYSKHSGLFYLFVALAMAIVVYLWFMVRRTNEYKAIGGGLKALSSVGGVVVDKLKHLSPDSLEYKVLNELDTTITNKITRLKDKK